MFSFDSEEIPPPLTSTESFDEPSDESLLLSGLLIRGVIFSNFKSDFDFSFQLNSERKEKKPDDFLFSVTQTPVSDSSIVK